MPIEEDEDLCLAQSYEFESMLSVKDDEEDLDCFIVKNESPMIKKKGSPKGR